MAPLTTIDLNADRSARREGNLQGLKVVLGDEEFLLPPELPLDVFSPFRRVVGDMDLAEVLTMFVENEDAEAALTSFLREHPGIAMDAFDALRFSLGRLFCSGVEGCDVDAEDDGKPVPVHGDGCQWPKFLKERPALPDYLALGRGLLAGYGVSLGEVRGSSALSGRGGPTSKPTSRRTSSSTPAKRSQPRARKASSA